jgi:hypothetical protein
MTKPNRNSEEEPSAASSALSAAKEIFPLLRDPGTAEIARGVGTVLALLSIVRRSWARFRRRRAPAPDRTMDQPREWASGASDEGTL